MKCFFLWSCIALIAACTSATPEPVNNAYTAPLPISLGDVEFITPDVMVEWDWPALDENQVFALRVWYEEEALQEVWLVETQADIQQMN